MIKIKQINKEIVKPVKLPIINIDKIKGHCLFETLYANIFLCAKKASGKSSTINKILEGCSNKMSTVVIFASTVHKDPVWIEIVKKLKKRNIKTLIYTGIKEDGINHVKELTESLQLEDQEGKGDEVKFKTRFIQCDESDEDEKERKPSKIAPEYILVFDDMASELNDPYVTHLMKKNKNLKMKIIISSQYYNDIPKAGRQQLDYILLFPNIPEEKLEVIYKEIDLATPYNLFHKLYKNATSQRYQFLYVDIRREQFRKNFNRQFLLSNNNI